MSGKATQPIVPDEWKWDKWQQELIDYEGSATIRKGRQVGCSTTAGKRRANHMLKYVGSISLIVAPAQRQSSQLFNKVLGWIEIENQRLLREAGGFKPNPKYSIMRNMQNKRQFEYDHGIYNELPTKTTIMLKKDFKKPQGLDNVGSICYALPAGKTGVYLRTYALDFLDIDEASYCPEQVYTALKPMLAVSEKKRGLGWETFLSTPFGKGGFFYQSHHSDDYRHWHVSSEDCKRISKSFLHKEKQRMTKAEYRQEYQGEFTDEWNQFFPTSLIKDCMTFIEWNLSKDYKKDRSYYLGVDIARYGGDENAFVVCELHQRKLRIVKCFSTNRISTTDTIGRIEVIDGQYKFNRIFVDDSGVGGAVTDVLIERLGRKVLGLNNASKRFEIQGEEKKRGILKEDLYSNALMLMETHLLEIISDLSLLRSLKSITYEYGQLKSGERKVKIYGDYAHLAEAFVRAVWCIKERGLDLYVF